MSQSTLTLGDGITFDLAEGWAELPSDPASLSGPEWRAWLAAADKATDSGDDGEPFDWMKGLVDPETVKLNNAVAKKLIAEAPKEKRAAKGREALPYPLNEIQDLMKAEQKASRGSWTSKIVGHGEKAALFWLFTLASGAEPAAATLAFERITRWSGVRVDGVGETPELVELMGDSYATMDWGLGDNLLRHYPHAGLVVFAVAHQYEALVAGFERLRVPPLPQSLIDKRSAIAALEPGGTSAPIGPQAEALLRFIEGSFKGPKASASLYIPAPDLPDRQIYLHFEREKKVVTWACDGTPRSFSEIAGYVRDLAKAGTALVLESAHLQCYEAEVDELALRTAWIKALGEMSERPFVAPTEPGTWVECHAEWAYWLDPRTLTLVPVKGWVLSGALVLDKRRDGHQVTTHYEVVREAGFEALENKTAAAPLIVDAMVAHARATGRMPPHTTIKKTLKNGTVEAEYAPNRYDTFKVRFTPEAVGADPAVFLKKLGPAGAVPPPRGAPVDEDRKPWSVEVSKTGRASCRTCKEAIGKGELRLGEPYEYDGHEAIRWHHPKCARGRLQDAAKLKGFDSLTAKQKSQLQEALG
ncbi:hypothetical protein A7982_13794 [Minicystis rosea]|nr:hypothetical protein A7982_13794 [Minicystis rosea]